MIIDTAGRLHTQDDLMAELEKIKRVIAKQIPEAPHETLLTVDATTGQNGLRQARLFSEAVGVNGLVLTKLDGTAKGGIALAIANELGIPVKLIGVGEQLEDLRPFDPTDFARALSHSSPAGCRAWKRRASGAAPRLAKRRGPEPEQSPRSTLRAQCSIRSQRSSRRRSPTSAAAAR